MVRPRVMPGQGRSPVTASLNRCMASWRGRWQVLLGMTLLGTAALYTCSRFPNPPILLKAVDGEQNLQGVEAKNTCRVFFLFFFSECPKDKPVIVRMMAPIIITRVCRVSV